MRQPVFTWPTLRWPRLSLPLQLNAPCLLCQQPLFRAADAICYRCHHDLPSTRWPCPQCGLQRSAANGPCYRCQNTTPPWHSLVAVSDYCSPLDKLLHRLNTAANSGWQPHWRDYCCWPYWPNAAHAPAHGPICYYQYRCIASVNGGEVSTKQHFWPSRCHTGCKSRSIQTY